jgi:hypothetical protein
MGNWERLLQGISKESTLLRVGTRQYTCTLMFCPSGPLCEEDRRTGLKDDIRGVVAIKEDLVKTYLPEWGGAWKWKNPIQTCFHTLEL